MGAQVLLLGVLCLVGACIVLSLSLSLGNSEATKIS